MIKESLSKIVNRINLSENEASEVIDEIMSGSATPSQIAAFITALRMKGETVAEITGCAKVMRRYANKIVVRKNQDNAIVVDTCGTGGDLSGSFNISTATAFVVAGADVVVAKHGNRAVSSKCGSADVLEALGVNIELSVEQINDCINAIGIAFLFAPIMHSAMKYVSAPRKELGLRTIFNILGPLTNPAGAAAQLLGVFNPAMCEIMANVLKNLGLKRAFVVSGLDGLDEISTCEKTKVSELKGGKITTYMIEPENFGIKRALKEQIVGSSPERNAEIILEVLRGNKGAYRDIVALNSAAAIVIAGKAETIKEALKLADDSIDSGKALGKLESLKKFSRNK